MRRLFGTAKPQAPRPTLEDANNNMAARGDTVDMKINKLDAQLAQYRDQLKKTRPGPAQEAIKRRALGVLKQKRLYEGQREQLYNQQFNLEQLAFARETMKDTTQQVDAMKDAAKEMKKAQKALNIDTIESLQDQMADLVDYGNEIQDIMGRSYGVPDDIDEDELMGELDALEAGMGMDAIGTGEGPSYLAAPDAVPASGDLEFPTVPNQPQPASAVQVDEFGLPRLPS